MLHFSINRAKDKVEMNEGEMNSFEKSFKTPYLGVWSWRKEERREETQLGKELGHEPLRERRAVLAKSGLSFWILGFHLWGHHCWKDYFRGFNFHSRISSSRVRMGEIWLLEVRHQSGWTKTGQSSLKGRYILAHMEFWGEAAKIGKKTFGATI